MNEPRPHVTLAALGPLPLDDLLPVRLVLSLVVVPRPVAVYVDWDRRPLLCENVACASLYGHASI